MKVIDLLNKIANGEEVPNKIRVNETLYWFDDRQKQYIYVPNEKIASCDDIYSNTLILTYEPFDVLDEFLNAEVEIIEEDNKIKPLKTLRHSCNFDRHEETLYENEVDLARKITELIDEVNNLKEGKNE